LTSTRLLRPPQGWWLTLCASAKCIPSRTCNRTSHICKATWAISKPFGMNLILNAVDAVQGDQADHEITISSRQIDADHLQVEVADRGCGIPAGAMKRVFEPFYSTKEPGRGAGLGLYTSYHIVRRHHGTLSVRSEEGQGTTVTATLPLRHTPRDENPGNSPATSQLFEVGIPASRQDTGDEDENEQAT